MGDKIKKHKAMLAVLAFLLITVPGALNAWLSLIARFETGGTKMTINWRSWQDIYSVIFPLLGLAVIIFGLWWTRQKTEGASHTQLAGPPGPDMLNMFGLGQISGQQGTKIVACFKNIYIKAMNILSSGNVNTSLFCDTTPIHWCGLKDQNFPYIVVQVEVKSQFPFNLNFIKPTAIECDLLLNKEVIAKEARLIWQQIQWEEPEKPKDATEPINIPALGKPDLLFRFQIDKSIRDDIVRSANTKIKSEWSINTDWKLHCLEAEKDTAYNTKLRPKELIVDLTK